MTGTHDERAEITSACPNCGRVTTRATYDIGSGPQPSCADCEWCWGAHGQELEPLVTDRPTTGRYRKKPVVITATRWWTNGDHPDDRIGEYEPEGDES